MTDSGSEVRRGDDKPGVTNLIDIMSVATGEPAEAIEARYDGGGYGQFKGDVAEAVVALLEPIQTRYAELRERPGRADRGCSAPAPTRRARPSAPTLETMYERMGFVRPSLTARRRRERRERRRSRACDARPPARARATRPARAVERQRAVAAAVQAPDGVADRVEHPLHLVLAALVEDELDLAAGRGGGRGRGRCGRRRARSRARARASVSGDGSPSTSAT